MPPMSDDQHHKARLKARDAMMRLTLWKLREMRDKYVGRPRTYRLARELRALKSLLRDETGGAPIVRGQRGRESAAPRKARKTASGGIGS
jgi:hypothetical protein